MSGGRFSYVDNRLREEIFGWTDKPTNVFEDKEISELVWDVLDLIHQFDWYSCSDSSEETYLKAKAKFKQKWFGNPDERIKRIIDETVNECRSELYKTFGVFEKEKETEGG